MSEVARTPVDRQLTILEDIGGRLAVTGYVFAVVSSAADIIGLGSHPLPGPPYFGILQSIGLFLGVLIIDVGLFLYFPLRRKADRKPELPAYNNKSVY